MLVTLKIRYWNKEVEHNYLIRAKQWKLNKENGLNSEQFFGNIKWMIQFLNIFIILFTLNLWSLPFRNQFLWGSPVAPELCRRVASCGRGRWVVSRPSAWFPWMPQHCRSDLRSPTSACYSGPMDRCSSPLVLLPIQIKNRSLVNHFK